MPKRKVTRSYSFKDKTPAIRRAWRKGRTLAEVAASAGYKVVKPRAKT